MTIEECRRRLRELEALQRVVSFAPDKAEIGRQADAMRRECERLEAESRGDGSRS